MTLKEILKLPDFSKFSVLKFSQSKFNRGGLQNFVSIQFVIVIGGRSVENLHKLTREGNQDLSNATLYGILKRSVAMLKKSKCHFVSFGLLSIQLPLVITPFLVSQNFDKFFLYSAPPPIYIRCQRLPKVFNLFRSTSLYVNFDMVRDKNYGVVYFDL